MCRPAEDAGSAALADAWASGSSRRAGRRAGGASSAGARDLQGRVLALERDLLAAPPVHDPSAGAARRDSRSASQCVTRSCSRASRDTR